MYMCVHSKDVHNLCLDDRNSCLRIEICVLYCLIDRIYAIHDVTHECSEIDFFVRLKFF